MNYGYFDDLNREYVITDPRTPTKWINYIGTLQFGGFVDHTGGALICKTDPTFNRITKYMQQMPSSDFKGETLYLRIHPRAERGDERSSRSAVEAGKGAGEIRPWEDWPSGIPQTGLLFHGDNKDVLAYLLANGFRGKVKLIYIDPPFDSGADYMSKRYLLNTKTVYRYYPQIA